VYLKQSKQPIKEGVAHLQTSETMLAYGLLGVVGVVVGDSGPRCLWPTLGGVGRERGNMEMVGRILGENQIR